MSIWVEKYRPQTIGDVVGTNDVIRMIQNNADVMSIPNLLLYGPPGTGKTSVVRLLCRYIYRNGSMKDRVLELNASDDRGIKVVREQIKLFASKSVNDDPASPPFKVVVLDEADAMTTDSQSALRRIMERYARTTRFVLLCNYIGKIIKPIVSRCVKVRFVHMSLANIGLVVDRVMARENMPVEDATTFVQHLKNHTNGDLRKIINLLQRVRYLSAVRNESVSHDMLAVVVNKIPESTIENIFSAIVDDGRLKVLDQIVQSFVDDGYSPNDLLPGLGTRISSSMLSDVCKCRALVRLATANRQLTQGGNDYVQLLALLSDLASFRSSRC